MTAQQAGQQIADIINGYQRGEPDFRKFAVVSNPERGSVQVIMCGPFDEAENKPELFGEKEIVGLEFTPNADEPDSGTISLIPAPEK